MNHLLPKNALSRPGSAFFYAPLLLVQLLVLLAWPAVDSLAREADNRTVRVAEVIDGDTVRLKNGETVRLIGINTPELGKDGRPDQPLAQKARTRLVQLLRGKTKYLQIGKEPRDRHGRLLGYLIVDDKPVQIALIEEGLGWAIAIPPNIAFLDELRHAETQARHANRGIWAVKTYQPKRISELGRDDFGFQLIRGTLSGTWSGRNAHLFSTDEDDAKKRARFVFLVQDKNWPLFGGEPQSLVGRQVEARGWISRHPRFGLRMVTPHPFMLGLESEPTN